MVELEKTVFIQQYWNCLAQQNITSMYLLEGMSGKYKTEQKEENKHTHTKKLFPKDTKHIT